MSRKDEIVKIPPTMVKFFGGEGEMVKPSPDSVAALVKKIPRGKLATLNLLRDKLARQNKVHSACPMATKKALILAASEMPRLCYWRVINNDGSLINNTADGIKEQTQHLVREGFSLDKTKKKTQVINFENNLVTLR